MTPTDLAETHRAAFAVDRPWSAVEFADLLSQRGAILCGTAASFVLGRVTFDEAEILTIATHPAERRKGLAHAALTAFCNAAAGAGAVTAFLEVAADNAPARALYAGHCFVQVGQRRGYYRRADGPPVDAIVLRRSLSA